MARPAKIDPSTALTERLREEGRDSRPAFSAALHARICDAVWPCGMSPAPQPGTTDLAVGTACSGAGGQSARGGRRRRVLRRSLGLAGIVAVAATLLAAAVLLGPGRQAVRPVVAVKASSSAVRPPAIPAPPAGSAESPSGFELVTDLADSAVEHVDSLVEAADASGPWAYLDQDARQAWTSLGERLPVSLVSFSSSEPSAAESSAGL
jgi:hypothetical protein